jgi:lipoprotein-releasing system permease protein
LLKPGSKKPLLGRGQGRPMNFPFFISKRYLFAKKSHSAINVISVISIFGVAVGTMALVIILSVFNGFDEVIKSLFNSFDPDIKITLVEGKVFRPDSIKIEQLNKIEGVELIAEVLEETALLQYHNKQYIAIIKGVSPNFKKINNVEQKITEGKYILQNGQVPYSVVGQGVGYYLGITIDQTEPLIIYIPRRSADITDNPEEAFNKKYITPSGIFSIEQDIDSKYALVPIGFARKILEYTNEVSALEIKTKTGENIKNIQQNIQQILGPEFSVKDHYQQQELFYKIMKGEKWAIFFILTFILIVASLNIIGSLTMLILDKKKDIKTLSYLGADWKTIRKVFLYNGWINSIIGALVGLILGIIICWLQINYHFVKLEGSGSFVIDYYPVKLVFSDIFFVLITVLSIGFLTSWLPVRVISRKYFEV